MSLDKDEQAELLKTDWESTEKYNWSLFSFVPGNYYLGALAVRNRLLITKCFIWDNNQI